MPKEALLAWQTRFIETVRLSVKAGTLIKDSRVHFEFSPGRLSPAKLKRLVEGAVKHGGKIGFRVRAQQQIKRFAVLGVQLKADPKLAAEFQKTLGGGPGEKWVAFPIPGTGALLRGGFGTTLEIRPAPKGKGAFQLVPVVVAFGGQDLQRHHVLGVSVLRASRPYVDTAVTVHAARR